MYRKSLLVYFLTLFTHYSYKINQMVINFLNIQYKIFYFYRNNIPNPFLYIPNHQQKNTSFRYFYRFPIILLNMNYLEKLFFPYHEIYLNKNHLHIYLHLEIYIYHIHVTNYLTFLLNKYLICSFN